MKFRASQPQSYCKWNCYPPWLNLKEDESEISEKMEADIEIYIHIQFMGCQSTLGTYHKFALSFWRSLKIFQPFWDNSGLKEDRQEAAFTIFALYELVQFLPSGRIWSNWISNLAFRRILVQSKISQYRMGVPQMSGKGGVYCLCPHRGWLSIKFPTQNDSLITWRW